MSVIHIDQYGTMHLDALPLRHLSLYPHLHLCAHVFYITITF